MQEDSFCRMCDACGAVISTSVHTSGYGDERQFERSSANYVCIDFRHDDECDKWESNTNIYFCQECTLKMLGLMGLPRARVGDDE